MPTTFNVILLGQFANIDTTEGNFTSENASSLVGMTFGGEGDALVNDFQTLSANSFSGGHSTAYDMNNNNSNDSFSIDGGPAQTFDGTAVYNATITYVDGTSGTFTAVIFQDTDGNTYLAPEFSDNADMAVLEAGAIRSLTLDSLLGNTYSGMTGSRETWDFVTCFVEGEQILTPDGPCPIEKLKVGDLVETRDNGAQEIIWIGCTTRKATGAAQPVRITSGALGHGLPTRDLLLSQQHRVLAASRIVERVANKMEVLVTAKRLTALPGIFLDESMKRVSFYHILCDRHEILFAEGAEAESLYLGKMALQTMDEDARCEIEALFPELMRENCVPAREILPPLGSNKLLERLKKNGRKLVEH